MIEEFSVSIEINENSVIIEGIDYLEFGGKIEYLNQNIDGSYNLQISLPIYEELEFLTPFLYIKRSPIFCKSNKNLIKAGTYYLNINNIYLESQVLNNDC